MQSLFTHLEVSVTWACLHVCLPGGVSRGRGPAHCSMGAATQGPGQLRGAHACEEAGGDVEAAGQRAHELGQDNSKP